MSSFIERRFLEPARRRKASPLTLLPLPGGAIVILGDTALDGSVSVAPVTILTPLIHDSGDNL